MFRRILFLLVLVSVWGLLGCTVNEAQDEAVVTPVSSTVTTVGERSDQCQIKTDIRQPAETVSLTVKASAETGIFFENAGQSESQPQSVTQFAGDNRVVQFNCQLDPSHEWVTGQYIVRVEATKADGTLYDEWVSPIFIVANPDGAAQVVADRDIFAQAHGRSFSPGNLKIAYDIQLDDANKQGILWLMVGSPADGYAPQLIIDSMGGGADFFGSKHSVQTLAPMRKDSFRIVSIPFQWDANNREGTYSFRVTRTAAGLEQAAEFAPRILSFGPSNTAPRVTVSSRPAADAPPFAIGIGTGGGGPREGNVLVEAEPWQRILNNYDGTPRDLYYNTSYIDQSLISWEEFEHQVLIYNPHLADDQSIFYADKNYRLP